MSEWRLSKDEYDMLLSYVGLGNVPNADIIVFGNEEGTGGYSVFANVKARVNLFGKDDGVGEKKYLIDKENHSLGYYHPSGDFGRILVEKCLLPNESARTKGFAAGVFNETIARICLSYEMSSGYNWFQGRSAQGDESSLLINYINTELYKPKKEGLQTALIDWRPLPRANETKWYREEYGLICDADVPTKNNPYLGVFNNPTGKYNPSKYPTANFSNFKEDMFYRAKILKNVFVKSKSKIIIGIGGANRFKKTALEHMFGSNIFNSINFKADTRNSKGQIQKAYKAKIQLEHKDLHMFLIPFPTAGQGFPSQTHALEMVKELYFEHIKPVLNS